MLLKIGHRGISGRELENSLAGFKLAIKLGLEAVELDVRLSSDGVPMVFHDSLLDRLTDSSGYLEQFSSTRLDNEVRLSNGEKIPTLEDVLNLLAVSTLKVYLEIKSLHATEAVQALVEKYLPENRAVISSFYHQELIKVKQRNKNQRTMALFEGSPLDPLALIVATNAEEVGLGFGSIDAGLVCALSAAGIDVYAWTVNDQRDFEVAESLGLKGVFTDYPL